MTRSQVFTDVVSLYLATFLSCIPNGILAVLISVKLKEHVSNDILISLVFVVQTGAGILFSKYIPKFGRKLGMINSIHTASVIAAVVSILFYYYFNYVIWLIITFIFGMCLFSFVAIRQTMLLEAAPNEHKAIISAASGMFVSLGIATGAILIKFIGHDGLKPHIIASFFYILSTAPMFFISGIDCEIKKPNRVSIWSYIYNSPKIMFGGFSFNYANASINSFLVIYGLKSGMSAAQASLLFSILLLGTLFSVPLGLLTDMINRRLMMLVCTVTSLLFTISIFLSQNSTQISTLLFLMFGFLTGIKLPALILINEKYEPSQRLSVISAFNKVCLVGSIVGVFSTGLFMKAFGPHGLWISIISALSLYLIFTLYNYSLKFFKGEEVLGDFFVKYERKKI